MKAKVGEIVRMTCLCGHDDRICHHCGHPFEAGHSVCGGWGKGALAYCPKCGCPSTKADMVSAGESRDARRKAGLVT